MKESSIDERMLTPDFGRMCAANFLLFASVYMLLTVLPMAMGNEVTGIYPAFLVGMLLAGPFQAYLADAFRRKHVLMLALAGIAVTMLGASYASVQLYIGVALLQGACFTLAAGAGNTISIDITPSGHRTSGNMWFALCGRVGMVTGMLLGIWAFGRYPLAYLTYIAAALDGVALLLSAGVYVPFRAPIGVKLCSLDRFWLGRAWLPALNVGILTFAFGMLAVFLAAISLEWGCVWMLPMLLTVLVVPPLVKMFVKLSHHCQRATGNMTFNLLMDAGLLTGIWAVCYMGGKEEVLIDEDSLAIAGLVVAVALFAIATYPYYKKKRVR